MSLYIPKIVGHRGAKAYAPENTLASIHTAADMGIEWVEVDVKLTKDGTAIIFHDDTLDRTTSGSGAVAETDWQTISELDAGSWFGESFIGEKIPTLEDLLEVVLDRNLGLNLEIKPCPGRELETAEVALDVATRIWPDDKQPPLISSFQMVSLETSMHMIPAWPRGMLVEEEYKENWPDMARYLEAATINIDGNATPLELIDAYTSQKWPVMAYTINDPEKACSLFEHGVCSVFSDAPDIIQETLQQIEQ